MKEEKMTNLDRIAEFAKYDRKQFKPLCWFFLSHFEQMSPDDRNRLFELIATIPDPMREYAPTWICSLLLHIMPRLDRKQRKIACEMIVGYLTSSNANTVSYAFETLGRVNYMVDPEMIDAMAPIFLDAVRSSDHRQVKQNGLICISSYVNYAAPETRKLLAEYISNSPLNVAIASSPPDLKNAKVVFYVADFLSGKSFLQYPTAEVYAATILNAQGHKAVIYDNRTHHTPIETVCRTLAENSVRLVVFDTTPYDQVSIYYVDYRFDRILFETRYLTEHGFQVILVGSHATVRPQEMLEMTQCRIAIKGEWELTLSMLANITNDFQNLDKDTLLKCGNIAYLDQDDLTESPLDTSLLHPEIEMFPMPDYDLINTAAYYGDEYEKNDHMIMPSWGSILAQRGCPYRCAFCYNFFSTNVRKRTPEQVVSEMELLEKKHGVNMLFFIDDSFTLDKGWLHKVCSEIRRRGLKCAWNCETRANLVTPEILADMKLANCNRIWLGVESFNDKLLLNAKKDITVDDTLKAIRMIGDAGIHVSCFLMIGLPGETRETIKKTLRMIIESGVEYTKSIITFIPRDGTPLFAMLRETCDNPSFYDMNRYKGILQNDISEAEIIKTIETMSIRNVEQWELDDIFDS